MRKEKDIRTDQANTMDNTEEVFRIAEQVAAGLVNLIPDRLEVVIHDMADPERSIRSIFGNVTQRNVGGSVTKIGLDIFAHGAEGEDYYEYRTRSAAGHPLRAITIPLRSQTRKIIGLFCMNVDISGFDLVSKAFVDIMGGPDRQEDQSVLFSDDPEEVIRELINQVLSSQNATSLPQTKSERIAFLKKLKELGVFSLQRAVPIVANEFLVSRATIYADLAALDEAAGETGERQSDTTKENP